MAAIAPFAPLTSGAVAPILVFDFVAWLNFSALVNFGGFGNLGGLGIFADAAIAAKGVDTGGAASFAFFFDVTFGIGLVAGLGLAGLVDLVDFGIGLVSFVPLASLASLATLASFLDTAVLALAFALVAAFDFTFVAGLLVFVVFSTFAAFFAITAFVVLGFLAVATAAFAVLTTGLAFSVGFALPFVTTFLMALLDAREDFFDVGKGFFATTFLATGFLETTFLTASFLAANFLGVAFADLVDLVDLAGLLDFIEPTVFATTFDFLIEAMMFSLRARNIFVLLDQKNANCRSARSEPK